MTNVEEMEQPGERMLTATRKVRIRSGLKHHLK